MDELHRYLAAALAKLGGSVDLTEADLDAALDIKFKTIATGLRVEVTWDGRQADGAVAGGASSAG